MHADGECGDFEAAEQIFQHWIVFLDHQAADTPSVQPKVAVADVDSSWRGGANCEVADGRRQCSQSQTIGSIAEFHPAEERLGERQRVEVLAPQTDERHCRSRFAEQSVIRAGVDEVRHRRDGASAVAFDRVEWERRSLFRGRGGAGAVPARRSRPLAAAGPPSLRRPLRPMLVPSSPGPKHRPWQGLALLDSFDMSSSLLLVERHLRALAVLLFRKLRFYLGQPRKPFK